VLPPTIKPECARFISLMLQSAVERYKNGDMDMANSLNLSPDMLSRLDALSLHHIQALASKYVARTEIAAFFTFDTSMMETLLAQAENQLERETQIRSFVVLGASKAMMNDLFGIRSQRFTSLRNLYGVSDTRSRRIELTSEQELQIYHAWLDSIETADFCRRLLDVTEKTGLPLTSVYSEAKIIEQVQSSPGHAFTTQTTTTA